MAEVTPMMKQYLETKKDYQDCILFYRLGDFYEMFYEDALTCLLYTSLKRERHIIASVIRNVFPR